MWKTLKNFFFRRSPLGAHDNFRFLGGAEKPSGKTQRQTSKARRTAAAPPHGRAASGAKLLKHAPNRVAVVAIVVISRIDIRRIDVQVVHVGVIVPSRGPEVAVRALIVGGAIVEVARER